MRTATTQELKQELQGLKPAELISICQRLARFKKENKELLTYLLFEAQDEESFTRSVKTEIEELFAGINKGQLYFAKKTLRKIVRTINKYSRYSGQKQTDLELRLFFCQQLKDSGIPLRQNQVISNIYDSQVKKITEVLATLHEDLQYDFGKELEKLVAEEPVKKWSLFKRKKS
jgi:hypothetical protein